MQIPREFHLSIFAVLGAEVQLENRETFGQLFVRREHHIVHGRGLVCSMFGLAHDHWPFRRNPDHARRHRRDNIYSFGNFLMYKAD